MFRSATTLALIGSLALSLGACRTPPVIDDAAMGDEQAMEGTNSDAFVGNIGDLMKDGKDVTCTFSRSDAGGDMEGTVFVARDGRMRGEFTLASPQFGTMTMQVIRDGTYGYTWGFPSATQGSKTKLDDEGKPVKENDKEGPGIDEDMEYRCSSWRMDASMFVPPSDVEFRDITAMVEAAQGAKCGVCENVPDAAGKENCRKAMGC